MSTAAWSQRSWQVCFTFWKDPFPFGLPTIPAWTSFISFNSKKILNCKNAELAGKQLHKMCVCLLNCYTEWTLDKLLELGKQFWPSFSARDMIPFWLTCHFQQIFLRKQSFLGLINRGVKQKCAQSGIKWENRLRNGHLGLLLAVWCSF